MTFAAKTFTGRFVCLEPLGEEHRVELRRAANDERIWRHMLFDGRGPEFDMWFSDALDAQRAGRQIPFAVRLVADGRLIGSTSYLDVQERHKRVEIGGTWYVPETWQTAVNPECKLLLLRHAFEVFGVNRVTLVTDLLNERSQAAIAKLGAKREGVLRSHMVSRGGRSRDSVIFGIIAAEWPAVRERLTSRLG